MFYLKDRCFNKFVSQLCQTQIEFAKSIIHAIEFPTTDEAREYIKENGWSDWDFVIEYL